jgi:hypothetical protein
MGTQKDAEAMTSFIRAIVEEVIAGKIATPATEPVSRSDRTDNVIKMPRKKKPRGKNGLKIYLRNPGRGDFRVFARYCDEDLHREMHGQHGVPFNLSVEEDRVRFMNMLARATGQDGTEWKEQA